VRAGSATSTPVNAPRIPPEYVGELAGSFDAGAQRNGGEVGIDAFRRGGVSCRPPNSCNGSGGHVKDWTGTELTGIKSQMLGIADFLH